VISKDATTKIKDDSSRFDELSTTSKDMCVFVVEDDPSMRGALRNLLRSAGFEPQVFASAEEFLNADRPELPSCLILDIRLPGLSGLDLQHELLIANVHLPIIFISGHGDDFILRRAMEAGAVAFLKKPFCDQDLLDAVCVSLHLDRAHRQKSHTEKPIFL